jgi:hypothetical protein
MRGYLLLAALCVPVNIQLLLQAPKRLPTAVAAAAKRLALMTTDEFVLLQQGIEIHLFYNNCGSALAL